VTVTNNFFEAARKFSRGGSSCSSNLYSLDGQNVHPTSNLLLINLQVKCVIAYVVVVAFLKADGFNCRKQPHRFSWYLYKGSVSYTLT